MRKVNWIRLHDWDNILLSDEGYLDGLDFVDQDGSEDSHTQIHPSSAAERALRDRFGIILDDAFFLVCAPTCESQYIYEIKAEVKSPNLLEIIVIFQFENYETKETERTTTDITYSGAFTVMWAIQ